MNKFVIACIALLSSSSVFSATINLDSGIDLLVVNGEKVEDVDNISLIDGENQLAVEFAGRLSEKGKREYFSSVPYIAVVKAEQNSDITIQLLSKTFSETKQRVEDKQPIFEFIIDGASTQGEQVVLPPISDVFPYSNVPALVKSYNQTHGLIFESGKIRSLKKELEQVQLQESKAVKPETVAVETETSLQMKLWYSRATSEERKAFRKWLIDQE